MLMADMTDDQRAAVAALWLAWLPEEGSELLELLPLLWSGWECDHHAALVRKPDGGVEVMILGSVDRPGDPEPMAMLEDRIGAYQEAIEDTRRFLGIARSSLGMEHPEGWACGSCGRHFHDEQAVCPACGAEA